MFSKLSLSFILTASLACVAQVSTAGGYGTASATAMTAPVAPVVSTPDIALPGSGPAVGAPLTNANDPRFSTGPSIANPNFSVSGAEGGSFTTPPASTNEGFEFGVQHVLSGGPASPTPRASLAEIALLVRARQPKAQRSFTNDSIAKLNAAGVRTGNLGPESSTAPPATELAQAPSADNSLVAENRIPALPQSDQAETTQVRPPQNSAIAAQQRHRVEPPAETTASSPAPASTQTSAPRDQAESAAKLPQTSSSLPIILLLGALGIAGGALFYLIRR